MSNKINPEDLQNLEYIQKEVRLGAFRDASDSVLDRGTQINQNDIKHITDRLEKGKKKYLKAGELKDKKGQTMVMNELPNMKKEWDNIMKFRKQISIAAADGQYGITDEFKTSTQGMDVVGILTGDKTPETNEDGTWGFRIVNPATGNPNWTSLRNISKVVKHHMFDKSSKKIIESMGNHMLEMSGQEGAEEFNRDQIRQKVKNTIIDKGNIRSLTHDKMLDDSFYNNTLKTVNAISYKNVGLDSEDGLNNDDSKQIVDLLLSDKEAHLNYLTDYYTDFMANNWIDKKTKDKNKNKQQEPTSASISGQGGGQIIGNKYIPKA